MAKKSSFFSDFKAFISRGNIVDMAVGVVIGGAFGKITSGLVSYIINPCISLLTNGVDLSNVKTVLKPAIEADEAAGKAAVAEVAILWGEWIQAIIDFLIIAFCIFCFIRIFTKASNKMHEKQLAAKAAADAAAAEAAKADAEKAAAEAAAAAAKTAAVQDAILEIAKTLKNK